MFRQTVKLLSLILFTYGCSPFGEVSVVEIKNPNINWNTTSYDYGNMNVGANASAPFTLRNTGEASVSGCGPVILSDSTNFSIVSNTCTTANMNSGDACQVEIASHPTTPGVKSLEITRQCADSIVVQSAAAQIISTGVEPVLGFTPLTFDFGLVTLGQNSSTYAFTLLNSGTADATGCSAPILSNSTDFSIVADSCSASPLSVGASCIVSVQANPQSLGVKSTTVIRVCSFGGIVSTTANQITATGNGAPNLAWSPLSYAFGNVYTGDHTATYQQFDLTNIGTVGATGCSAPVISDSTNFSIIADTCSTNNLAPNSSCYVRIEGNSLTVGLKSATLSRTCTYGGIASTTTNQITMNSVNPNLSWSPMANNFGNVNVGFNSVDQTFTLTNSGTGDAIGCGVPNLTDVVNFSIISNTCGTNNLASGGVSCDVVVRSHPITVGAKSTTLSRTCTKGGVVTTTNNQIVANGTVTVLSWSPMATNFGNVHVGSSSLSQTFTLSNSGGADATGCSAPVLSNTTDFLFATNTCGTNDVAASGSCTVSIQASPQSTGVKTATLSRSCSYGGSVSTTTNQITVTGTQPNLAWSPLINDFGSINVGSSSSSQTFTLSNSGGADATGCSAPVLSNTTDFLFATNTCGTNDVAASGSCTVSIQASPQSTGVKTATLSRSCSYGGSVSTTTNQITVTGTQPNLAWSLLTKNFGNINVNDVSSTQWFQLTNSGTGAATSCSAPILTDSTNFTITADTCASADLSASSFCGVDIRANPVSTGTKTTTLSRTCSIGGITSTTTNQITVIGTQPVLAWSPLTKAFGNVIIGFNSTSQTFTLTNSGTGPATGCSAPVISNTTDFTIISDNCSSNNLTASSTCSIDVVASPVTVGAKTATISRSCTFGGTVSTTSNQITTTGVVYVDWQQEFGLTSLGNIKSNGGSSNNFNYFFRNPSGLTLTGCSAPALSNTTDFTIVSDNCGAGTMAPKITCEVKVKANPLTTGNKATNLTRTCAESGAPTVIAISSVGDDATAAPTQISVGTTHSCALFSTGGIKCWGENSYGGLGNSTNTNSSIPVLVTGINNAVHVSAGRYSSCAVLSDGTIKCWGYNNFGGLGNGSNTSTNSPVTVSGISNGSKVYVGIYGACALLVDGTVKCWGYNYAGQLGNNSTTDSSTPVVVSGLSNVTQLNVGAEHSCARLSDSTIKCWGSNWYGKLGDGNYTNSSVPVLVSGISNAVQVAAGEGHTCAVLTDGTVKCWGYGYFGYGGVQLSLTGIFVPGISTATQVMTGASYSCVTLNDNSMKCWGDNTFAQLGDDTSVTQGVVTSVNGISNVNQISGYYNTCALLSNNSIKCWGRNDYGQLGDGLFPQKIITTPVTGLANVIEIVNLVHSSCALLNTGGIKCWGRNNSGQLGNNTYLNSTTPVDVTGITNAIKIAGGHLHACALLADQSIKCWGENSAGQLGDGTTTPRISPVTVSGINNATKILLGMQHSCALLADQSIKCWGNNFDGQLGDGTTTNRSIPISVLGISGAIGLGVGSDNSCAILNGGSVKCWGRNYAGQLGNGTYTNSLSPVNVTGITNAIQMASVEAANCALLSTGLVKCWGFGHVVGDGTTATAPTPVTVAGVISATQITGGRAHFCVLLNDQTMKCWGYNNYSQLGDATVTNRYAPVFNLNTGSILSVGVSSSSAYHQCNVKTDNTVACVGGNVYGQSGATEYYKRIVSGLN